MIDDWAAIRGRRMAEEVTITTGLALILRERQLCWDSTRPRLDLSRQGRGVCRVIRQQNGFIA